MSRRYTYSRAIRTPEGEETFTAQEFDSFDEAKNAVDKGIRSRRLELAEKAEEKRGTLNPPQTSDPVPGPSASTTPSLPNGTTPLGASTTNKNPI